MSRADGAASGSGSGTGRYRRPASLDAHAAHSLPGVEDPTLRGEIAHTTAGALVHRSRLVDDPDVVSRLITLVETEGLDVVAGLWSDSPADTLPGALWRLYVLREWVRRDPETVTLRYRLGVAAAPVHEVVAGAAGTSPEDMARLADAVLTGVFAGDLAVALERAAAFCRILAAGAAIDADAVEHADDHRAARMTHGAGALVRTAEELEESARLWRADRLE